MAKPSEILILSNDSGRVRDWTRILTDCDTRLWQGVAQLPSDTPIDVIVTDDLLPCDPSFHPQLGPRLAAGEVGIVRIGAQNAGDVCLPEDFAPRELRLACLLLTEVVRLRRQCRRGRRMQRLLNRMAFADPLTGLPNRRAWEDELQEREARAVQQRSSVCLALLDLDLFKSVNDRLGHLAGDDMLRHVGKRLDASRRNSDFVARLGGDEFALLLDGRDPAMAAREVEEIRVSACQGAPHAPMTASVGFAHDASLRPGGLEALFHAADAALRDAKAAGRNRRVAAPSPSSP
jgi:diguanylate cyclase (GGDEF)-like protein